MERINTLSFAIPGNPSALLSPNSREHWAKRNKEKVAWADATTGAMFATAGDPFWTLRSFGDSTFVLDYDVYWGKGRKEMDDDNFVSSMKGSRDAMAEFMGVNDRQFRTGNVRQFRAGKGPARVVVTITRDVS